MAEKRCMRCGHGAEKHRPLWELGGLGPCPQQDSGGFSMLCEDGQRAAWALPLRPETPRPVLRLVKGGRE